MIENSYSNNFGLFIFNPQVINCHKPQLDKFEINYILTYDYLTLYNSQIVIDF